jgi:hypothetical protein
MTIDVEQQVGTKDDGYSSKNKQTTTLIFSLVLKKALVVEIHFFYFSHNFLYFSLDKNLKRWNHKFGICNIKGKIWPI